MELQLLPVPLPHLRDEDRWFDDSYRTKLRRLNNYDANASEAQRRLRSLDGIVKTLFRVGTPHLHVTPAPGMVYLIACCLQRDYYIQALYGEEAFVPDANTREIFQDGDGPAKTGLESGEATWDDVIRVDALLERHKELIEQL